MSHRYERKRAKHGGHGELSHNQHGRSEVNVNEVERHLSLIGGTAFVICGLLRGSLSGLALAAIGGGLIYRGHTGHCHLYEALDFSSTDNGGKQRSAEKQAPRELQPTD